MTALDLMRSRYTAYVRGDTDHLLSSWHPDTRPDRVAIDPAMEWTGLTVVDVTGGGPLDQRGEVEFRATFRSGGRVEALAERSVFTRHEGRWAYHTGRPPA